MALRLFNIIARSKLKNPSLALFVAGLGFAACSIESDTGLDDLEDDIEDLADNVVVCDGMTLSELSRANDVSDGCRADLEGLLPRAQNNFETRLAVIGSGVDTQTGKLQLYVQGASMNGAALDAEAFADARVSVTIDGDVTSNVEFSVRVLAELDPALMSIGFVNDYSTSMRSADLDIVGTIFSDIINVLPAVYEGEVTYFSEEVLVKQPFTTDESELLDAVARDAAFDRQTTALYDGIGTALDSLITRERPIRLLIVSTDGLENASMNYEKAALIDTITDNHVAVLMLGALFADVSEMRQLAGPLGFFFYTPTYDRLRSAVSEYVASLGEIVAIELDPQYAEADSVEIELDGASTTAEDLEPADVESAPSEDEPGDAGGSPTMPAEDAAAPVDGG
jgi:hypothetical protein